MELVNQHRRLSRRAFLSLAAGGAAGLVVQACGGGSGDEPTASASPTRKPTPSPTRRASPSPTATATPSATPGPTLEVMAGQMILVGFDGQTLAEATQVAPLIEAGLLGGVVLFAGNVSSPDQVSALTSGLQGLSPALPLIIATDEEGGLVARLDERNGFPPTVSEQYMAENGITRQSAGAMADALASAGIGLNLAPVVDVNVNPSNPIIGSLGRSFSADPHVVSQEGLAFVDEMHARGVLCTLKHFPGHGSSTMDSHVGFTDVTSTWSDAELIPFRDVIAAGAADMVMTAHIFNANLDTDYPATLSYPTVTGILREQLGYDGVVITDSITMRAITDIYGIPDAIEHAINAGVDMISISGATLNGQPSADAIRGIIVDAVNAGRIPEARVGEAYRRITSLRARISA